ncbi:hypothetical protein GW17_00001713 [Ensete ventricosum]|nr:hypothetical protein GW17_00001713 [Ensete ventricosum]
MPHLWAPMDPKKHTLSLPLLKHTAQLEELMDCLQEWPEPVVPVQSLSEAPTLPDRYVKPPSQRPSVGDAARSLDVPVVDLAMLPGGGVVEAVSEACRHWGFFQVVNHGVSLELVRRFREAWRGFFHLPMVEKKRYANSPRTYEGYGSRLGIDEGASLDWGDYYFLHFLPCYLKDHDKWPALPPCLRYPKTLASAPSPESILTPAHVCVTREATDEYGVEVRKLCRRVMRALSLGLGLDADRLQRALGGDDEGVCIRVNFYPRCPRPDLALGLSPHSDPGGMTVLLADDHVHGLQIRKDGVWITAHPLPNALIINVGDQIQYVRTRPQVLSNAEYKSVEHRVIVHAKEERLSVAFFYNPRSDIPIGPVPELLAAPDRAALYRPMTFDDYRLFIRRRGPRGKSQVESLEAMAIRGDLTAPRPHRRPAPRHASDPKKER